MANNEIPGETRKMRRARRHAWLNQCKPLFQYFGKKQSAVAGEKLASTVAQQDVNRSHN
jgi:hypothetical protein